MRLAHRSMNELRSARHTRTHTRKRSIGWKQRRWRPDMCQVAQALRRRCGALIAPASPSRSGERARVRVANETRARTPASQPASESAPANSITRKRGRRSIMAGERACACGHAHLAARGGQLRCPIWAHATRARAHVRFSLRRARARKNGPMLDDKRALLR